MTMNIVITREQLEEYVPSMVVSSDDIFNELSDFFVRAEERLERITGVNLISVPDELLVKRCSRYICLRAVYEYIPQRDLVITPNGFGVVSDANIAPASKERVENLRHRLAIEEFISLGVILGHLISLHDSTWQQSNVAMAATSHLIFNSDQLAIYCGMDESTEVDFRSVLPDIGEAENVIIGEIGFCQFQALLDAARCDNGTVNQRSVIRQLRTAIGLKLKGRPMSSFMAVIRQALNMMGDTPTDFAPYFDSPEYRAKSVNYENHKEDSCYFF